MPATVKIFQTGARLPRCHLSHRLTGVASHRLHGPAIPAVPLVVSVPHAGRDYPAAIAALRRVPMATLAMLEDRHVDALGHAARGAATMIVQERARAWIDLNRREDERDPRIDDGADARTTALSAKVRVGLGLVPRRTGASGDLWRRRLGDAEVRARIEGDHRPYHAALAALLAAARARFGVAMLVDLHSMPSLPGADAARIVIGDRFGRSAAGRFVDRAQAVLAAGGHRAAVNVPYAGGHILDRHGAPAQGIHAIQVEIDRRLYLDAQGAATGPGFDAVARLLRTLFAALIDEAGGGDAAALAAE